MNWSCHPAASHVAVNSVPYGIPCKMSVSTSTHVSVPGLGVETPSRLGALYLYSVLDDRIQMMAGMVFIIGITVPISTAFGLERSLADPIAGPTPTNAHSINRSHRVGRDHSADHLARTCCSKPNTFLVRVVDVFQHSLAHIVGRQRSVCTTRIRYQNHTAMPNRPP